jgi:hypothetical protein
MEFVAECRVPNHPSNNVVINEREIQVCKFYIDNLINIEINGGPIDIGVVCIPLTLKQEEHWNNFIKYCFENKACTGENFEEMNVPYGQPAASELVVNPFAILKMNSGTRLNL